MRCCLGQIAWELVFLCVPTCFGGVLLCGSGVSLSLDRAIGAVQGVVLVKGLNAAQKMCIVLVLICERAG